jgi:hypothetical protein
MRFALWMEVRATHPAASRCVCARPSGGRPLRRKPCKNSILNSFDQGDAMRGRSVQRMKVVWTEIGYRFEVLAPK